MEFFDLSRYYEINDPIVLPFYKLRTLDPLWMTQDLMIVEDPENLSYADELAKKSITVVPIRRIPPFEKYVNRKDFPRRILFEMTSRCNVSCRMCPQQNLKRPKIDFPWERYCDIIDEIEKYGVEQLSLFQFGEPLLHKEFESIINFINTKKNLGVIWISTNGELLTEEKIHLLLKSNIDYINFSANAVTEKSYLTIINKPIFSEVQSNLEKLYCLKDRTNLPKTPFIRCQMIEQETTRHEIDEFILKHYKRADIVSINMLEHLEISNNQFGFEQRHREPLSACYRVSRNEAFIWSNGWVGLCDAAYNGEIYLGDVNKKPLFEIWNGEERKRILSLNTDRIMTEIEFCRSCNDYDI